MAANDSHSQVHGDRRANGQSTGNHYHLPEQRDIAEILVTILAPSRVQEGFLNPVQPGGLQGTAKSSYAAEQVRTRCARFGWAALTFYEQKLLYRKDGQFAQSVDTLHRQLNTWRDDLAAEGRMQKNIVELKKLALDIRGLEQGLRSTRVKTKEVMDNLKKSRDSRIKRFDPHNGAIRKGQVAEKFWSMLSEYRGLNPQTGERS
jgi:hypothetical protein